MAKRYKLTLDNIKNAVERCPYVACKGPFSEDYEIFESKDFLEWIEENLEDYGLKIYRKENEAFFRVEVIPSGQQEDFTEILVDFGINAAVILAVTAVIYAMVWMIGSIG